MKQPEKYFCDVCGAEIVFDNHDESATGRISFHVPVITRCEWTEGHAEKPRIETLIVDICNDCHMKSIGLECGYRGENLKLRFMKGGEDVEG